MQRYGPPFAGGYRQWPLRWLKPVSTALNVYEVLTAFHRATSRLKGDDLAAWKNENKRLVKSALDIERIRSDLENGNPDIPVSD
jgi:hypothetical protein